MKAGSQLKSKPLGQICAPARSCECCGKVIVFLRLPGFGDKTRYPWYRRCYIKSWDGNPWYVPGSHQPHRIKLKNIPQTPIELSEPPDPFFSL